MHFANNFAINSKSVKQNSASDGNVALYTGDNSQSQYRIYLLLTDYPDRVSKALKRLGFWHYSHISVSTSMVESDFYSFVGKKGFRTEKPLLHPTFKKKPVNCAFISIPVTKEVCEEATKRIKYHIALAHTYRYSYLGLILTYFDIRVTLKKRYTCAGFVGDVLDSGMNDGKKHHRLLTPDKFLKRFNKHVIYKGTLEKMLCLFASADNASA